MQLISLKNFKSYENQIVNNLNTNVNVIIGRNGEGKSNFFKAIAFALTDRVSLNRNQYNSHLHRAIDNNSQPIAVELYVRSKMNQRSLDQSIYKLERIWSSQQTEELRVDEKIFSRSDFQSFVESLGFSYSNAYNILQQGKINQVIMMDQFDLYKLLQEATNIKKYEKRHEEALGFMRKNKEQKEEIEQILKEIETRLQLYQSKKEEYQLYSFEEKANKVKNKAQYEYLIKRYKNQIAELIQQESRSSEDISKVKMAIKAIQTDLEQLSSAIAVNQKQIYEHFDESTAEDQDGGPSVSLSQDQQELASKLKQTRATKEKMKKELQKVANQTEKIKNQLKPYKEKYESISNLITADRLAKQGKDSGKDQLKKWIQKAKENMKEIDSQLKKVNKMKAEFKVKPGTAELTEQQSKKEKLAQINNQLKANKIKYFESGRLKNQYQSEVDVLSKQIEASYSKMRKVLPLLEFNLLNQIRKEKLQGVYGFLIEFVDILPTVLFAYEMAGLNKLCTLLVENQEACQKVISLNKKIKGKQINVLPLSFIKRQPVVKKNLPSLQDCYSLLNQEWIKIKPHSYGEEFTRSLEKIIMNSFNSHILVKDYDIGLKVSKQFHLNCITADKQIVYSEGFLCKVGKDINVDDRLQLFYKYSEKNSQAEEVIKKLSQQSKKLGEYQNNEMELMKKRIILESELTNLGLALDVINQQKKSIAKLEEEEVRLIQKKKKYEVEINRKQQVLDNFDKKISRDINMQEFRELEEMYNNKLKIYNRKAQEQGQLEANLLAICKEQEDLAQKINTIASEISFQKDFNISFIGGKQYRLKLQKENEELESKKKRLQQELLEYQQKLSNFQNTNYSCLGNISLLEDQINFYSQQLQQIGTLDITMEQVEERSNSFSVSMSRMDDRRKVRIYTTIEKLMFSKIQGYYQKYKDSLAKYKQLEQVERQINEMLQKFQTEKDKSINSIFANFEKHFDAIFKTITIHGQTDVRLKKINQKTRGFLKVRNSISIMVSFESDREVTKKWSQFSGGQKTVIAICLLMALQKCQPAPFYIFDEIDAALDPIYLQRIIQLIEKQSEHSQYFISSFKRAMMRFPDQKCNYYLVENRDRVSTIKRITQEEAERTIDKIIES